MERGLVAGQYDDARATDTCHQTPCR
jgi:hypothetical protein